MRSATRSRGSIGSRSESSSSARFSPASGPNFLYDFGILLRRLALLATLLALTLPVSAQNWRGFIPPTVAYDGRFVLARLYYPSYPGWSYDWPEMEENFNSILKSISSLRPHPNPAHANI